MILISLKIKLVAAIIEHYDYITETSQYVYIKTQKDL